MIQKYRSFGAICWFADTRYTKLISNQQRAQFFQDVTPYRSVIGYRCFRASYRFHLQGSSVSSSPSSSSVRSGGTCPHGLTYCVPTISNARSSIPLAAKCRHARTHAPQTELYRADISGGRSINRSHVFDNRPTQHVLRFATSIKCNLICSTLFAAIATSRAFYDYVHATQKTEYRPVSLRIATSLTFQHLERRKDMGGVGVVLRSITLNCY